MSRGFQRGFEKAEFQARVKRAQTLMQPHDFAALLLTCEPDVRYFSGYLTRFWESPTRPWYLVIPSVGDPVAVIPSIGAALMRRTWIKDIRTWRSPDLADDGVSLLIETLKELAHGGCIATPMGHETHIRMPMDDLARVQAQVGEFVTDAGLVRALRMVKSPAEITKIKTACAIADRAFSRVPEIAQSGVALEQVFRCFQMLCLEEGADFVPYLAGASDQDGYLDVISPATDTPLTQGDVLMLDTGLVHDGYFCDFDRNWSVGAASSIVQDAHKTLIDAIDAAMDVARAGITAADLFHAMDRIVTGGAGGSDAGRLGHGLGMQLTEWPSLIPTDHTVLESGMVLTLEPGIKTRDDKMIVHEENIVITDTGAEFLSTPSAPRIMQL